MIIPPSFVATIFLRISSTCADAVRSRCATASFAGSFDASASSDVCTPLMRSTANVISLRMLYSFIDRSYCACRSAAVAVERGSARMFNGVV